MKINNLIAILAIAGTSALTSCSDFLEAENKANVTSDVYFSSDQGFENLCSTPYYKLRALYSGTPTMFCSGTDLYGEGRNSTPDAALTSYNSLNSDNKSVADFYKKCYDGIQQANTVIYYGEGNAKRAKRVDEAKVLKCFYYYLLSQHFGGVPISDKYIQNSSKNYPKSSQAEVYKYIIDNLKAVEAANVLPADDNTGRVSMRFVYNLLAKTCLAAGWDLGVTAGDEGLAEGQAATVSDKTYFEEAAHYADLAIGGKELTMSFSDMWDVKNDNNSDIMFAIQYTRGISGQDESTDGNSQCASFSNYYNDTNNDTKYTDSQFPVSDKAIYLFEPGDKRYEGTFMVTMYEHYYGYYDAARFNGDKKVFGYYPAWYEDLSKLSSYNQQGAEYEAAKVASVSNPSVFISVGVNKRTGKITYTSGEQTSDASRKATGMSPCCRKFDDYTATRNTTKAVSFHNIVLAHLSETYLIAAEAYYMAGNSTEALKRLNAVRKRSGATELTDWTSYVRHYSDGTKNSYNSGSGIDNVPSLSGSALNPVDIILDERARELFGEGYRWMDLRRTKRLIDCAVKYNTLVKDASNFKGLDGNNKWFRPLPNDEMKLNDALSEADQNPGY